MKVVDLVGVRKSINNRDDRLAVMSGRLTVERMARRAAERVKLRTPRVRVEDG